MLVTTSFLLLYDNTIIPNNPLAAHLVSAYLPDIPDELHDQFFSLVAHTHQHSPKDHKTNFTEGTENLESQDDNKIQ